MNRLLFEKTGDAVYLSHLDLMRVFQRAFKRADIMIWHSQGFSPRAYVSIALPLSVGASSSCEILDFDVEDGSVDLQTLPEKLNRTMPEGIRVLRAYTSDRKIKHLSQRQAQVCLEYDGGVLDGAQESIAKLFSAGSVIVRKHTKRGEADVDIRPMLLSMQLRRLSAQELCMDVTVQAQNPGLNPQLLVTAIETHLPQLKPDFSTVRRVEVLDADGSVFR